MTRAAYARNREVFWDSVGFFRKVARLDWACIKHKRGLPPPAAKWGFKEPFYVFMLPAVDEAFRNRSKYLIIARDPRDICTNRMIDMYYIFGGLCLNMPTKNFTDCFEWWAAFWHQLLGAYERDPRFAVLRIEDLTMPDPTVSARSMETLRCMVEHIGMGWNEPSSLQNVTTAQAARELNVFHSHRAAYMGHHNNQTDVVRWLLTRATSQMTTPPLVHQMMRKLGYDPTGFRLQRPESHAVLCRGS